MPLRIQCLTIDAHDPAALARFWAAALGWRVTDQGDDEVVVEPPEGATARPFPHPDLLFLRVPDEKRTKNRLHLDLRPDDRDAEVRRLEGLGARRVDIGQGDVTWIVMADPEGNEFCVLRALEPQPGG